MEWIVIFGLALWAGLQTRRIGALQRELTELRGQALAPSTAPKQAVEAKRAAAPAKTAKTRELEPLLLTNALPPEPEPPLLLDTPVPDAANNGVESGEPSGSSELDLEPDADTPPQRPPIRFTAETAGAAAIAAAFAAPAFISASAWPPQTLTLCLAVIAVAGFALAWFKRWSWAAATVLAGLYLWFGASILDESMRRALSMVSFASLGAVALAYRPALDGDANEPAWFDWDFARATLPTVAVCIGAVLLLPVWGAVALSEQGLMTGPALIGAFHVALTAFGVRARTIAPSALVVAVAALAGGFMLYLRLRFGAGPLPLLFYGSVLFAAFVVLVSALGAHPYREGRKRIAIAGAAGAGLLAALAASSRLDLNLPAAWLALFAAAALLFAAAWRTSRYAQDQKADAATDSWFAAGAVLALIGVEGAFPETARAAAHAGAAMLFAGAYTWRGWRAPIWAALAAALLALGYAISPQLFGASASGGVPLHGGLLILASTTTLLFGASMMMARREGRADFAEALQSAAIAAILISVFLLLRWFAAGAAPILLDTLSETGLQAAALMLAGHALLPREGQDLGRIGAWRGHVLLGLGALLTLVIVGLTANPWWGGAPARIDGPPLLDTAALALLAPVALSAWAAARLYAQNRNTARVYAVTAGGLALMWAFIEIRRMFHGEAMAAAPVGVLEGAVYALAGLAAAMAIALTARVRLRVTPEARPFSQDLDLIARGAAWTALIYAVIVLLVLRHPWWGALSADIDPVSGAFATMAQGAAMMMALLLGRVLSRSPQIEPSRFAAAAAAVLFAWSAGHVAIRWIYHYGEMSTAFGMRGFEGFGHALWPLVFVLAASELTQRAPARDQVRPYLYDLEAIWSWAIWPALAWTCAALWLIFNPWWGIDPVLVAWTRHALGMLGAFAFAAWLCYIAPRVPYVRAELWFNRITLALCLGFLFVAATLFLRGLHHVVDFRTAPVSMMELWSYSALLTALGAVTLAVGYWRNEIVLRWFGVAALGAVAAKVLMFDMAEMAPAARAGALIGIAALGAAGVALERRLRKPPVDPGLELVQIKPSARRDAIYGRRRRSS